VNSATLTHQEQQRFSEEWLAWTSLRHFLGVPLLRDLSSTIVNRVSGGSLKLSELFIEVVPAGEGWNETWFLQPREVSSPLANYLQSCIRAMAWQNDVDLTIPRDLPKAARAHCIQFDQALRLGAADLNASGDEWDDLVGASQKGISVLARAVKTLRAALPAESTETFADALANLLSQTEEPLAAAILKHVGDLCADVDAWREASVLYQQAQKRLMASATSPPDELAFPLLVVVEQSRAAAAWILEGAAEGVAGFRDVERAVRDSPLFAANASHDELVASYETIPFELRQDRRATVAFPPLLQSTHDVMPAVRLWLEGNPADAIDRFWAVLRRQIALGAITQSRGIKALYARSTIDLLKKNAVRHRHDDAFLMAVKLIVESGNTEDARRIAWDDSVIGAYLTVDVVQHAIQHAGAHEGSKLLRQRVIVEVFGRWIELVSLDHLPLARSMLEFLANLARDEAVTSMTSANLGGRALEILRETADTRPELRSLVEPQVFEALIAKLSSAKSWGSLEAALLVARAYADVFAVDHLEALISIVLTRLSELGPASPIVRPAFAFLLSEAPKAVLAKNKDATRRVMDAVLEQAANETSSADILFYLHGFDSNLLTDTSVVDKLRHSIDEVRRGALEINASNTVEAIQALLLAPAAAGHDGVSDALIGLASILESAKNEWPSIVIAYAYQPLILLANRHEEIASAVGEPSSSFRTRLVHLVNLIVDFWKQVAQRPLILAQFSIPPATIPDRVIAHNWTYASIAFAVELGEEARILEVLDEVVRSQPSLADPIIQAKATRSAEIGNVSISPDEIRKESRDVFYALLGYRLSLLSRMTDVEARECCSALIDQCIRQGPREVDAAIFLLASRLRMADYAAQLSWSDYTKRARARRELGSTLMPVLESLGVKPSQR
jgi:hypothetical protein